MSQNHNHPIPLLMQSVALHIVALWFLRDYCVDGCRLINAVDVIILGGHMTNVNYREATTV